MCQFSEFHLLARIFRGLGEVNKLSHVCAEGDMPLTCLTLTIKVSFLMMTPTPKLHREPVLYSALRGTGFYFPLDSKTVVSTTQ